MNRKDQFIKDVNEAITAEEEKLDKFIRDTSREENVKIIEEGIQSSIDNLLEKQRDAFREKCIVNIDQKEIAEIDMTGKHEKMSECIQSLLIFKQLLMVGPTGSGKTTIGRQIADELKLPFAKYAASEESTKYELIGYREPDGSYVETDFVTMYRNGGVFLVDEYDAMPATIALFFNGLTDGSQKLFIPFLGETLNRHKDFYLIFAGNTWGSGGIEYTGRDTQDKALMDRLKLCKIWVDYNPHLEKGISGEQYVNYMSLRKLLTERGYYFSTRNMADCETGVKGGIDRDAVIKRYLDDIEERNDIFKEYKKLEKIFKKKIEESTDSKDSKSFRRTKDEIARGLTVEQAKAERAKRSVKANFGVKEENKS